MLYRFGEVEVDVARRQVRVRGEVHAVPAKAFEILVHLIENRDRVVERRELLGVAWPDVTVEDGSLTQNVSVLRRAIEDSSEASVILTVAGVGYQFTGTLEDRPREREPRNQPSASRRTAWAVVIVLFALSLGLLPLVGHGTSGGEAVSIAVLPARTGNFASDGGAEGLRASGVLIAELSRDARLSVRPMSDVVEFADPRRDTALEAGRQLGVTMVLEASLAASGQSLELQLIDVSRRQVIWSGMCDLEPSTNGQALSELVAAATRSTR